MDDEEEDDDVSSTVSNLSDLSGLSDMSGQDWKPMAGKYLDRGNIMFTFALYSIIYIAVIIS